MYDKLSFVRRVSQLGTLLMTRLCGIAVGEDSLGNRYFRSRRKDSSGCESRWVLYKNEPEASLVPPEWYRWLHHSCDQLPLDEHLPSGSENGYVWQKPHRPNLSGTEAAPLPAGHPFHFDEKSLRCAQGRYQSWNPPESKQ